MNTQILTKANNFIKKRLIELTGISLILVGIFLFVSIFTYSPNDPNFIYTPENTEIINIGGFYGSVISDFFLQAIGLIFILLVLNITIWGFKLIIKKKINNIIPKFFYILIYIIFGTTFLNIAYNESFLLIDNGNGGFVGRIIKENIYNFIPLIENKYSIYGLISLTIVFFILSSDLKINEIYKILLSPLLIIKKTLSFFIKDKENNLSSKNINTSIESDGLSENISKIKQPILPFSSTKEKKINNDSFKLPSINFLEINSDLKNKKNGNNVELNKNSEFLEKILLDFGVEVKLKELALVQW